MRRTLFLATFVLFCAPSLALAQSIVWNTQVDGNLCEPAYIPTGGWGLTSECHVQFDNPNVSVAYNVQVLNAQTGEVLSSGSTVPSGTSVEFQFVPHVYTDVSWFATGSTYDSPYGDWSDGAAMPTAQATVATQMCDPNDFVYTYGSPGAGYGSDIFGLFEVNPPQENISGLDGYNCTTTSDGSSETCTFTNSGTISTTFNFQPTYGEFYGTEDREMPQWQGWWYYNQGCSYVGHQPMYYTGGDSTSDFSGSNMDVLNVPAQSVPFVLNVTNSGGSAPTTPTASGGNSGSPSSCTVGEPYTITFSSTDPAGNQIKYGIDWDDSGSVEEFVPSSGDVPSGTTETASRTFAVSGDKTIKVIAINSNGLSSGWATISASCTDESTQNTETIIAGGTQSDQSAGNDNGNTNPALQISASPSILKPGETTNISWNASNVVSSSCLVTGSNGDGGSGVQGWIGAISAGIQSSPINEQTIYTLSCLGLDGSPLTQSATVNIIPVFVEH